ncbi:hypothetical protein R3P38DRAFT_3200280 [Favolaschia claudopus]|uniref:Uncharacterized protein n=1 Tax=Favolaschia claudopus TaxID=2862362 RepID=A0AAW0B1U0_9AGAR
MYSGYRPTRTTRSPAPRSSAQNAIATRLPPPQPRATHQRGPSLDTTLSPAAFPPGANISGGEYQAGRVVCEVCGEGVSFRDSGGAFTLKHWEAHRGKCTPQRPSHRAQYYPSPHSPQAYPSASPSSPYPYSSSSSSSSGMPHSTPYTFNAPVPAVKKRRTKRTEEERIDYLRSDPYVAEFEAYRVRCAACDKWIRLRPNSTYCSIPWDAHRKSCVEKQT